MNGLDELLRVVSMNKSGKEDLITDNKACLREKLNDNKSKDGEYRTIKVEGQIEEKMIIVMSQVRGLLIGLSDEAVRDKMNNFLAMLRFEHFMEYYTKNDGIAEYTVQTELSRMDFKVLYKGDVYTDKKDIGMLYYETSSNMLWRLANQSIYAELILCLHNNFPIRELNLSVSSKRSSFVLDFDNNHLMCESIFVFQSVNESMNCDETKLFELADIRGIVQVSLVDKRLFQYLQSPTLRILFDDKLREIAENIVLLQNCGQEDENDATDKIRSLLDIRQKLLFGVDSGSRLLSHAGETALAVGNGFLESMVMSVGQLLGANASTDCDTSPVFPRPPPRVSWEAAAEEDDPPVMSLEDYLGAEDGGTAPPHPRDELGVPAGGTSEGEGDSVGSDGVLALGGEELYVEEEGEYTANSGFNAANRARTGRDINIDDWDDWD